MLYLLEALNKLEISTPCHCEIGNGLAFVSVCTEDKKLGVRVGLLKDKTLSR